ncbi:MAG: response regulator [Candidatus Auribacter fodinae]|jgi:putative two-component system response regulator|uniref:Response regulator n=1 Tax=Candidatus Auribacter fodinae TaxID=2093366 RepID=A0A3A4R8E4_9BACT|nr:MAG: response regulator [Candidatus Auribacter fodinae]
MGEILVQMGRNSQILIIDDNPDVIKMAYEILISEGYQFVSGLSDLSDVIGWIKKNNPELILIDVDMPQVNGLSLLKDIVRAYPGLEKPVLMMVDQKDDESKRLAFKYGAYDFVSKPFNYYEMHARVRNVLSLKERWVKSLQDNSMLEKLLHQQYQQIHNNDLEMLQRLGRAGQLKDNDTGQHVERVSLYSALIAGSIGLPSSQVELIRQTSPMHDIGKIGIPDEILLKPGKLTPEEMEIMKRHCVIGAEIFLSFDSNYEDEKPRNRKVTLKQIYAHESEILRTASLIAYTHHEKWDGSGYPGNLKGSNIPIEGRIVAVADVFDALTTDRPYKSAFSLEKTVELMQSLRGSHFDPEILDEFFNFTDLLEEIQTLHPKNDTKDVHALDAVDKAAQNG